MERKVALKRPRLEVRCNRSDVLREEALRMDLSLVAEELDATLLLFETSFSGTDCATCRGIPR